MKIIKHFIVSLSLIASASFALGDEEEESGKYWSCHLDEESEIEVTLQTSATSEFPKIFETQIEYRADNEALNGEREYTKFDAWQTNGFKPTVITEDNIEKYSYTFTGDFQAAKDGNEVSQSGQAHFRVTVQGDANPSLGIVTHKGEISFKHPITKDKLNFSMQCRLRGLSDYEEQEPEEESDEDWYDDEYFEICNGLC